MRNWLNQTPTPFDHETLQQIRDCTDPKLTQTWLRKLIKLSEDILLPRTFTVNGQKYVMNNNRSSHIFDGLIAVARNFHLPAEVIGHLLCNTPELPIAVAKEQIRKTLVQHPNLTEPILSVWLHELSPYNDTHSQYPKELWRIFTSHAKIPQEVFESMLHHRTPRRLNADFFFSIEYLDLARSLSLNPNTTTRQRCQLLTSLTSRDVTGEGWNQRSEGIILTLLMRGDYTEEHTEFIIGLISNPNVGYEVKNQCVEVLQKISPVYAEYPKDWVKSLLIDS